METLVEQKQPNRLVVLIDENLVTNTDFAHAIHWIATRENLPVLYLVLVSDRENIVLVTRDLATMKAVTSANRLTVEAKVTEIGDWLEELRKLTSPGDIIVCQEEQTISNGLFRSVSISDFLSDALESPVRTVSGYYHPRRMRGRKWFYEVIALLGFLIILSVFTWLQVRLEQTFDGSTAKVFILLTFCVEMGAVWAWNKFTFQ